MNYLFWKQHYKQFMLFGVFLLLFALIAIPSGLNFWHTYQHALAGCGKTGTCSQLSNGLFKSSTDGDLFHLMQLTILAVPVLLGLFWGAPLIAKEYAEGSNKLIWMQGMSRRKWLTAKLLWMFVAAAAFAGAFAALATWWSRSGNTLYLDRFAALNFSVQGIVPAAYAVFAVAVGIAFGAWFKRTLLALAVTLGVLAVVQVAVPNLVRPHYATPRTYVTALASSAVGGPKVTADPLAAPTPAGSSDSWVVSGRIVNREGQTVDWANPPEQCNVSSKYSPYAAEKYQGPGNASVGVNGGPPVSFACLTSLGYRWSVKYQPSYRYWDFQRIEVGLYLALSVIPISATYWLVLKRDA